jgi:hypothetical protein
MIPGSILVLCLWLVACVQGDETPLPAAISPSKDVSAQPSEKQVEPPKLQRRAPPPALKPGKTPLPSPEELVGLDETGVRKILGAPSETRTDGAARILTYRSVSCVLDVILLMDLKAGDLRVASYQWVENGGSRPSGSKGCYGELRVPQ